MKKLTLMVYHREYDEFLHNLQELGVMHVMTTQEGETIQSPELDEKIKKTEKLHRIIEQLQGLLSLTVQSGIQTVESGLTPLEIIGKIESINEEISVTESDISKLKAECEQNMPWGNFSRESVSGLKDAGYEMNFFISAEKDFQEQWTDLYHAVKIKVDKGKCYFVTITPTGEKPELNAEKVQLPEHSLNESVDLLKKMETQLVQLKEELRTIAGNSLDVLRKLEATWRTDIEFDSVKLSTVHAVENKLMILEGWIPQEKEQEVKDFLINKDVYYNIRIATKEDNAPIKLRNNAFVRMYEVLTKMYGMPEYGEFDPTPILAPFFTLFFAFCMGDAGYGIALILLGLILKRKLSPSMKGMMNLVITLGTATTVLGAIFGTFFGVDLFKTELPQFIKQFMITGKIDGTNYDKQMLLALMIGVVHICIAMTVKAICTTVRYGFKESISQWAWLILIVGFISTAGLSFMNMISQEVSNIAFIVIGSVSAIGIYLLNNLRRNIFLNIGSGLWDTYNMATGLMGDILSYIRLYALGLAGAMLGGVFNQLAFMVNDGVGGVVGIFFCALILILGHTLNIAMSCLSAFVHPLRLTFVEYFKNSGYEGKGEAYKPFAMTRDNE